VSPHRRVVITIDGPAGTGKSTVAHRLARCLGLEFLDTGAMYRAAAVLAIESGIDTSGAATLAGMLDEAGLHFDWQLDPPGLMLGDRDVSARIRKPDVAGIVSTIASLKPVREILVALQRRIADAHPRLVTEGRDQGSVVFPDAPLRFYLDADLAVRAKRRGLQLEARGSSANAAEVMSAIHERDRMDSMRAEGPLRRPEGAIEIDTSELSIDEVVARLEKIARERLPDAGFAS